MAKESSKKGLRLETPSTYRIRVQGRVDSSWADRLGGMTMTEDSSYDQAAVTILEGHLPDQAALSGVLNTLYEMHLPLLSVESLDEPNA
jgi:hypothetical protein